SMAEQGDEHATDATGSAAPRTLLGILDQLQICFFALDDSGLIQDVSEAAVTALGRPPEELVGRDLFREIAPELEEHGLGSAYRRGATTELEKPVTLAMPTPGGERRFNVRVRIVSATGRELGFALLEDLSPLAAEEKRRKRAESLASVSEL